jgi:hypothetical protein
LRKKLEEVSESTRLIGGVMSLLEAIEQNQIKPADLAFIHGELERVFEELRGELPAELVKAWEEAQREKSSPLKIKAGLSLLGPSISIEWEAGVGGKVVRRVREAVKGILALPGMHSGNRLGD